MTFKGCTVIQLLPIQARASSLEDEGTEKPASIERLQVLGQMVVMGMLTHIWDFLRRGKIGVLWTALLSSADDEIAQLEVATADGKLSHCIVHFLY